MADLSGLPSGSELDTEGATSAVAAKALTRALTVNLDPRVAMSPADLALQLALLRRLGAALERIAAEPAKADTERRRRRDSLEENLLGVYGIVEGADDAPTAQAIAAVEELEKRVEAATAKKAGAR